MSVSAQKLRRGDEDGAANSIRKHDLFLLVLCLPSPSPLPFFFVSYLLNFVLFAVSFTYRCQRTIR